MDFDAGLARAGAAVVPLGLDARSAAIALSALDAQSSVETISPQ
jgi:hypothetical protein